MSSANQPLPDKIALVTGSSRNIGRAIARALAENGSHVVIHAAHDQEAAEDTLSQVESCGMQGMITLGDLADPQTAPRIIKEVLDKFGRLDTLVNNAAIRPESPFSELSFAEWRRVMSVCLDAVFLTTHAALLALQESTEASIINIGGLTAHTGAANRAHVISAKAGVVGFTKALAHELSPEGITVNCVSPGLIETVRDETNKPQHHATRTNLVNRRGQPEEIAEAVAFLAGPSGRYITGQTLHINGGAYLA
ncbi:MAG: 3-oxoacyl-ACP reductase FabG [Gammaproteobacteria bacterium]|nr:3-oxoacyl-ACP reductase FabG [Gammaproteobacteria bacterium]